MKYKISVTGLDRAVGAFTLVGEAGRQFSLAFFALVDAAAYAHFDSLCIDRDRDLL